MEWLTSIAGTIGCVDTAPFIYLVEEHPKYLAVVEPIFLAMETGSFSAVTSVITLMECEVLPRRNGDIRIVAEYRDILLNNDHLYCIRVSEEIAERAAQLRADFSLRTPDAIQLATALQSGAGWFLTNDTRLRSLPGLEVVTVESLL